MCIEVDAMKYWNKDKRIRQQHWFPVKRNSVTVVGDGNGYQSIKRQLQLTDSPGKFYLYFGSDTVWFERSEDATWFALSRDHAG